MLKKTLYGILSAASLSMLLLLAGFVCWQVEVFWLAGGLYHLAGKLLLFVFVCGYLLACCQVIWNVFQAVAGYFSREQRSLRRLLMLQGYRQNCAQTVKSEMRQQRYRFQFKRERLLAADDRKHSLILFKSIQAELKPCLTPAAYRVMLKDLRRFHRSANTQAMLALREQALCRDLVSG